MDILDTVFVTTPGTSLRLEGDAMRAYHPENTTRRIVPLHRVESLVLWRGVDASSDLLRRCATLGIHVTWITQNGKLCASITGHEPSRPDLRLAQFRAHENRTDRVELAQLMIVGKLQNTRQLLLRAARDTKGARQQRLREVAAEQAAGVERLSAARTLTECLGVEGYAARRYIERLDDLIPGATGLRTRRPPLTPIDCYLSSTYGLLRTAVHAAVVHVGFDPYIGFVHGIRSGKPALVLDLMEQFRPLLADRLVASLFNRDQIRPSYLQTSPGGAVALTDTGWKHLLGAWVESRQRPWPHKALDRKVTAAELPVIQARSLARHLREGRPYDPWIAI